MVEQPPATQQPAIGNLVVIGLGLIGGSLAKAARVRQVCQQVWGVALTQEVCDRAVELGIVDQAVTQLQHIAPKLGAGDVIFIAVPTLAVKSVLQQIHACVPPEVTITDGASVKGSVLRDVQSVYGHTPAQVVLGHPIAGSEKSGVEAANPDLYAKHRVILTPTAETDATHLARVTALWQAVGAEVLHLDITEHDEILGSTSHLPHAIAFSLVDTLAHDSQNQNIFRYAAGGFRDFTRIASSDAVMWRDIMLANDRAVLKAIDLFSANLARLRTAIEQHDEQTMLGVFTRAKAARDHFSNMLSRKAYTATSSKAWDLRVTAGGPLHGAVQVPGDKSISHRSVMLAAIAQGESKIEGFLEGEDALATIQALRDMGVVIEGPHEGRVVIHGVGLHGLRKPSGPLYVGNAGTSMRLLCGILAAQKFDSEIFGDDSLNARPMARIAEPLSQMGAVVHTGDGGKPPLLIKGGRGALHGIQYRLPVASAQVKSCLLLASLYATGTTKIAEPVATRDHTERLLQGFGCPVSREGEWLTLAGGGELRGSTIVIPGDFSSATFLIVAATLCQGSDITLLGVGVNPTRTGALRILQSMGADIELTNQRQTSGEPLADIRVKAAPLRGVSIPLEWVSLAIDEFPALLVAAACADGITELTGAAELRLKESDRIQAMAQALVKLGISCTTSADGMVVHGGQLSGGEVDSCGDHRVAMALAVAGVVALAPVVVKNCTSIATSFPNFVQLAKHVGISIERIDH